MRKYHNFFNVILCVSLCSNIFCLPSVNAEIFNAKERTDCILKIQNAVKRITNTPNISNQNAIKTVHDAKKELEHFLGYKINMDYFVERAVLNIENESGQKLTKDEFKYLVVRFRNPHIFKAPKLSTSSSSSQIEDCLPENLVYHISVCLVGIFLITLPMAPLQDWGKRLVTFGALGSGTIIANYRNKKKQEQKRKEKNKKKEK